MLRHSRHVGGRKQKISKLAPFVHPPATVHCSIVTCVSRDWLQTSYTSRKVTSGVLKRTCPPFYQRGKQQQIQMYTSQVFLFLFVCLFVCLYQRENSRSAQIKIKFVGGSSGDDKIHQIHKIHTKK